MTSKVAPRCPIFGDCGGCSYQDISYQDELNLKQSQVERLLAEELDVPVRVEAIQRSPNIYHYRHRLDLALLKTKHTGEVFMGFSPKNRLRVISARSCAIAMKPISTYLPTLYDEAVTRLPKQYRMANLVLKTGADGRVQWGGIGRHSLKRDAQDYLWAEVAGKRIYYSLDTFFQANLSILDSLIKVIRHALKSVPEAIFFDLYCGVGFFGVLVADLVQQVVMIENNPASCALAHHNIATHNLKNAQVISGPVEELLEPMLGRSGTLRKVVMVDPPRRGLGDATARFLAQTQVEQIFYLSCHLKSLLSDLKVFLAHGWEIAHLQPFDFFPRTDHIETLVILKKKGESPS